MTQKSSKTEARLMRVASYEVRAYWEKHKLRTIVVDCGGCGREQRHRCRYEDLYLRCPRAKRVLNLDRTLGDGPRELKDTLADDKALDLDAWVDARVFLRGCPRRLLEIACKRVNKIRLSSAEQGYLNNWRWKNGIRLRNKEPMPT